MIQKLEVQVAGAILIAAVFCALGAAGGWKIESDRWAASVGHQQAAAAVTAQNQAVASAKVETLYVDRIQQVQSPPQIRDRLVRIACPDGMQQPASSPVSVPGGDSGQPSHAATPADAGAGQLDELAVDAGAAEQNAIQLEQLQALVRANAAKP